MTTASPEKKKINRKNSEYTFNQPIHSFTYQLPRIGDSLKTYQCLRLSSSG